LSLAAADLSGLSLRKIRQMVKKNPTPDKVSSVACLCRKSPLVRLCALRDSLSQAI